MSIKEITEHYKVDILVDPSYDAAVFTNSNKVKLLTYFVVQLDRWSFHVHSFITYY